MDNNTDILNSLFSNNDEIDLQRPYRVMDVANYIVQMSSEQGHPVSNLLLLKMLYYLQAFFLVNTKERLFAEDIQKWGYGPVEPIVYSYFKNNGSAPIIHSVEYVIDDNGLLKLVNPQSRNLQKDDIAVIDRIVDRLYDKFHDDPFRLVEITHNEPMWKKEQSRIQNGVHNIKYSDQEIIEYFRNREQWPWQ